MNKVIRDGKVAVLYSPDYGAGWYSWNTEVKECLFDPDIVKLVEEDAPIEKIEELADQKWPGHYWSAGKLKIEWVPEGTAFEIHEYDGSERIQYAGRDWLIA